MKNKTNDNKSTEASGTVNYEKMKMPEAFDIEKVKKKWHWEKTKKKLRDENHHACWSLQADFQRKHTN